MLKMFNLRTIVFILLTLPSSPLVRGDSFCGGEEAPEDFKVERVTICPTGQSRREKQKNCPFSSNFFHCLPDESGNLYEFCARNRRDLRYDFFVVDSDYSLHFNNILFPVSFGTETEFFSNLTQIIVKEEDEVKGFAEFENLQENPYTASVSCKDAYEEHFLPARDSCQLVRFCAQPKRVPCITINILDVRNGIGNIIEKKFPLSQTNTTKYSQVALALCKDFHLTLGKQCNTISKNNNDYQKGNNTEYIECPFGIFPLSFIGFIIICIASVSSMAAERKFHLIDKFISLCCYLMDKFRSKCFKNNENRHQSKHRRRKYTIAQPADANGSEFTSSVLPLTTIPSPSPRCDSI